MLDFISPDDRLFLEHFNCVDFILELMVGHIHFAKASFAYDAQELKVTWLGTSLKIFELLIRKPVLVHIMSKAYIFSLHRIVCISKIDIM